jgi:hypothetical protein
LASIFRRATNDRSLEAGFLLAGQERRWTVAGIIADKETEADITARRPPKRHAI